MLRGKYRLVGVLALALTLRVEVAAGGEIVLPANPRGADTAVALADYRLVPAARRELVRYVTLATLPEDLRGDAAEVLRFWLPHLSREALLAHQRPAPVGEGVYRLSLSGLGWQNADLVAVAKEYPYSTHANPLIIRGDWLIRVTSDAAESPSYYTLLYGDGKAPTDRGDFYARWKVDLKLARGSEQELIANEGTSGVALGTRQVRRRPTAAGTFAWETEDSVNSVGGQDPIERLGGGLKFDAGEIIVGIPKIGPDGERCAAQAYLLTDGAGKRVDEANARIVIDNTSRIPVIRTPGSCVRCHAAGINALPKNAVREMILDGVELPQKKIEQALGIERRYLGRLGKVISRDQEDFETFVRVACEIDQATRPADVVAKYAALLSWYDKPVDLDQAARELYAEPAELRLAIAALSEAQGPTTDAARLIWLAHEKPVPRKAWEKIVFRQAHLALLHWRASIHAKP